MSHVAPDTIQSDLHEFVDAVDRHGELAVVSGAHWDKEMGAVTEVLYRQKVEKSPMLVFDNVPGYPEQYRCLYGMFGSPLRLALAFGMEPSVAESRTEMLSNFRNVIKKGFAQVPPKAVADGPVLENVLTGDDIDLLKFPVPVHHELDGGRYIGTACGVVTRDPDTGRVNIGTYRVEVTGKDTCASYISNGKQGRIQRDKYLNAGKPCPVIIIVWIDPITYLAAGYTLADKMPELDWCGGVLG
ncbi:MAG: UbiD family decarboxylase domain-containing protein, partial [Sciscionella sp.]